MKAYLLTLSMLLGGSAMVGCDSPAENAMEDVSDAVEDTADDAGDAIDDAADAVEDAADDATE